MEAGDGGRGWRQGMEAGDGGRGWRQGMEDGEKKEEEGIERGSSVAEWSGRPT